METPATNGPAVREIENTWIPLADGTRLAARIWLPADAESNPVPAVLEYLPYRKDDLNLGQYASRHPYFAAHGYAGVCVDLRGTGDSDGILLGEYLASEQDDALEVIAWLAEQPWCDGNVGMIGYSWGGFNGLQVAARRPPALKAVVTMYSTDNRYTDDCHYAGGCLLGSDMLKWASWMRLFNALPPDPRFRDDWREVWLDRLERTPAYIEDWVAHPTYDDFWKQGSVAEDYSAIEAATLVVGGWTDAYTNAVPRLLEHLACERRGIIGPWAHVVPSRGVPGPAIGFLQECVRWFDRWLKGTDTGVERDPFLRVWMQDSLPPATFYAERPGRWIAEKAWPPEGVEPQRWVLGEGGALGGEVAQAAHASPGAVAPPTVQVATPQHLGQNAGVWCANGLPDELPEDQQADDALSVCFDSPPLAEPLEVLGFPVALLAVSSDVPAALVAVRLCEVAPDGASTLLTWGQLNLTHRVRHEWPEPLEPGKRYEVAVQLNAIGQRISAGNRLRLAISTTHWPHAWPSPEAARLTIALGGASALELPTRAVSALEAGEPFAPPEESGGYVEVLDAERTHRRHADDATGTHAIIDHERTELAIPATGTTLTTTLDDELSIVEHDPLSARITTRRQAEFERAGLNIRIVCDAEMTATATEFVIDDRLRAWEGAGLVLDRERRIRIQRHSA